MTVVGVFCCRPSRFGVPWSLGVGFMQEHCLLRNFDGFDGTAMSYTGSKDGGVEFCPSAAHIVPASSGLEKFRGLPMPSSTYLSQSSHFALQCLCLCLLSTAKSGRVPRKSNFTKSCKWSVTPPFFFFFFFFFFASWAPFDPVHVNNPPRERVPVLGRSAVEHVCVLCRGPWSKIALSALRSATTPSCDGLCSSHRVPFAHASCPLSTEKAK